MLEHDWFPGYDCTCLMFMKPTNGVKLLLANWGETIVDKRVKTNQARGVHYNCTKHENMRPWTL